ncbi:hypothetical protein AM493_18135 [Flavobacterium akiainvivens]|uniref:Outer membrane protein beta-barrel domain-containing protein n=1 Tax=Flavobacterium akiainvivens TaxID=1202724 RepID=A0A0M8MFD6_9FLAO|nr:hypothetical protein [Flavobacterium akiainvivens]KOS07754.1 hypothetical protein AM493_18135 [Flavobacterium akiainvivens]SFQ25664.1 hypothetical protein SAMN05444144_102208 [Flavobacterium akiainvivens]
MENKQDIGKAFKDRLGGLHREPGDAVWQNINASLQQQKRGGFRMPFWGKATSIVLGVVLLAVFTYPQWEQYMPEIIIKMPGEKQQTTTGTASGNGTGNSTTAPETGTNTNVTLPQGTATPGSQGNAGVNSNAVTATDSGNTTSVVNSTTPATGNAVNASANNSSASNTKTTQANTNRSTTESNKANSSSTSNSKNTAAVATVNKASAKGKNNSTATKGNTNSKQTVASTPAIQNNPAKMANATNQAGVQVAASGQPDNHNNVSGNAPVQNQNNNVQNQPATNATSSATTPVATITGKGRTKINTDAQFVYSAGNFPTITKAMADSLLLVQKKLDDEKSRERSFAKPAYALQDNLSGGEGYRNDFYVFAFVAPTNYKFGESTSLIDPSLNNSRSSAETSTNFGAYVGYEFSSQFSVRAGVSSMGITQNTTGVTLGGNYSGVTYADGMSNTAANVALGNSPVTLRQKTSIVEVPVEATYALFGTRADLYFKGGFSMFFMGDNELHALNNQGSVLLGSLNRANDFSLSGNAGFGFYYKFVRELQLNVEPGFKYYFNTFEGVNPISLYVQAGLQYRF